MLKTKMFSIFLIYLFSSTCSRSDLAINWANNYIKNYIDQHFDMNSLQLELLGKSLDDDILKVRQIIFPKLADKLQKIHFDIQGRFIFKEEQINTYIIGFREIFDSGLVIFEPSAQRFVNQLSFSQVVSFKNNFDKKTKQLEKTSENIQDARKKDTMI